MDNNMNSWKRLNEKNQVDIEDYNQLQNISTVLSKEPKAKVKVSYSESSSSDEDDDEKFFIQNFSQKMSNSTSKNQNQSDLQKNKAELETKKMIKRVESFQVENQQTKDNQAMHQKMELSSSDDSDEDVEFITNLQKAQQYQNLLKEINEEKYVSIVITEIIKKNEIPQEYWQAFNQIACDDHDLAEKDINKNYTSTYLRVSIKNNKQLEEKLKLVEIGLLLIGSTYNDIEYDIDDQANFLGKFNYQLLKMQNQTDQRDIHLFFSILHQFQLCDNKERVMKEVFSSSNILIMEPDQMLYPTLIAQSTSCYRIPLIKMKFKVTESTNWNMLKGVILHDIFQHLMTLHSQNQQIKEIIKEKSDSFLTDIIKQLYTKYLEELFLLEKCINTFEKEIKYIAKNMMDFLQNYLIEGKLIETKYSNRKIKIKKLVENEMVVNNEALGLKGQIDCVFKCEVEEQFSDQKEKKYECFLPFELKTGGKKKQIYEDQNLFYCLLLNQKYDRKQNLEGFLYYLSLNDLTTSCPTKQSSVNLLTRRNKLAKFIKNMETQGKMPEINIERPDICKFCYEKEACYANQLVDDYDNIKDIEDLPEKYKIDKQFEYFHQFYDSLTEGSKLYLKKWIDLIQMEQQCDSDIKKDKKQKLLNEADNQLIFMTENFDQFFSSQVEQLQTSGYIQSQQNLSSKDSSRDSNASQKEYEHIIYLRKICPSLSKLIALSEFYKEGESFVLYQMDIKCKFKAILEEKTLQEQSHSIILKLKSIQAQVNFDKKKVEKVLNSKIGNGLYWSLESYNKDQYPDQRQNVLNLILNKLVMQSESHQKLKEAYNLKLTNKDFTSVIIDNFPPKFQNNEFTDEKIEEILNKYPNLLKNVDQADSIKKILKSESLTCILGMPGTGKTFLIAHLIKILADQKKKVLVTSFTNSALDNIIVKLLEIFPEIKNICLRKGSNKNLIHSVAQEILYNPYSFEEERQFSDYLKEKQIYFATIIGSNNKLFHSEKIKFDYCIIDEASQCVEPLCLGPMLICDKSILIGDHFQLQPLVKNEEAGKQGLSISLFERMCNQYPLCQVKLKSQFRMNNKIMELSNIMVYNNQLKAFDDNIGNRKIKINEDDLKRITNKSLNHCMQPNNEVVFIDTSLLEQSFKVEGAAEEDLVQKQSIEENRFQIKFICLLIKKFQEVNIQNKSMALITPYNFYRVQFLKNMNQLHIEQNDLELFTVDKSQGIDKDIIILHISDKIGNDHLLSNWRRTNVAITRSKMKLIIVGNQNVLNRYKTIDTLMTILQQKKYVYQLTQQEMQEIQEEVLQLQNPEN
ncbi:DNA replication helicase Dna2, putative (macronuclear) [Tetrahymena thermophila SB210]|uniref:DNA replication helicase Dna2, putative n=1 Tax=Tetrahymena thermophila (strain SB210) TaxID=312017 RepID=I7MF71_TETTS|nr:DNA replication helicase Dna2, putative [Tetrahymena thermophila SB210]EAR99439.2 DNA replication helicase Dna2, putative [Tetrahymena thermophila SB210]|eukprot:XP_001019684.2 DNA replication helicase Dna2, putative [Tetrahymena thermophila SB210]